MLVVRFCTLVGSCNFQLVRLEFLKRNFKPLKKKRRSDITIANVEDFVGELRLGEMVVIADHSTAYREGVCPDDGRVMTNGSLAV